MLLFELICGNFRSILAKLALVLLLQFKNKQTKIVQFVCGGEFLQTGFKCQVYSRPAAFVSERVKGCGSAVVAVWWRMGLRRASPLPVQRPWGSGVGGEMLCDVTEPGCPAVLPPTMPFSAPSVVLPATRPFRCVITAELLRRLQRGENTFTETSLRSGS